MNRSCYPLIALFILCSQASSSLIAEENVSLSYAVGPATTRDTLVSQDYSLTYNVRPGVLPHVFGDPDARLDWMVVNKPPRITDSAGIFDYSRIQTDVAWSVLTVNLSASNATVKFERTIDLTRAGHLDLDLNVNLSFNYIMVDSANFEPFNVSAKMTLKSLNFTAVKIAQAGEYCVDCTVLEYAGGTAVFLVDPYLSHYSAEELAGWISWNILDLVEGWVGHTSENMGVIIIGEEGQEGTLRQFYSSQAQDTSKLPLLEVNYTIADITIYNNRTYNGILDLNEYFWDPDGDGLTFTTSDDHPNILIEIDEDEYTVDMQSIDNWVGTEYVVFTAHDGMGGYASSNNVTLTVIMGVTTTTSTTTTTNAPPIVGPVEGIGASYDPIILVPGSSVMLQYNATLYDADGCNDINTVSSIMWNDLVIGHSGATDGRWLYENRSCAWECFGNHGYAMCAFNVHYYADNSTQWHVNISAWDGMFRGHNVSQPLEILDLAAMNISVDMLAFTRQGGPMTLDQTSDKATLRITNLGNVEQDVTVSGTDLDCEIGGSIPVGNIRYSPYIIDDYDSMCGSLTAMHEDTCEELDTYFNLDRTDDGTPSQKPIYWILRTPQSGVGGRCSGTLNVYSQGK